MQLVEQLEDARLRGHRQRDVDQLDATRLHVGRQVVERAEDFPRPDIAEATGTAVVEEAGDAHPEQRVVPDPRRERAAQLASARDHRHALGVLCRDQAQHHQGHRQVRREPGGGRREQPGDHDALVEKDKGQCRPADEQQQRGGQEPAAEDFRRQRADAGGLRLCAGKSEREDDKGENQVGAFERHAECLRREHQAADGDNRIDRRLHQRRGSELVIEEAPLRFVSREQHAAQTRGRGPRRG